MNLFPRPGPTPSQKVEKSSLTKWKHRKFGRPGSPLLEVRDTESEEVLIPIEYFKEKITGHPRTEKYRES
ncbi:MAG: hypothetical protein ACLR6J_19880 [Parabacteroides merdae]